MIPHVWGSAVGLAAGLHAVSTLPPSPYTANPIYLENEVFLNLGYTFQYAIYYKFNTWRIMFTKTY